MRGGAFVMSRKTWSACGHRSPIACRMRIETSSTRSLSMPGARSMRAATRTECMPRLTPSTAVLSSAMTVRSAGSMAAPFLPRASCRARVREVLSATKATPSTISPAV